jgi:acid phosphatase type 7
VINSNCSQIVGCGPGSPEDQWLRSDLAAHPTLCTLAYWHHPRFHSVWVDPQFDPGDSDQMGTIWQDLYNGGADVVLNAHTRVYERFAPQNPDGVADSAFGIREFIVGTGGRGHHTFSTSLAPNSEVRNDTAWGLLQLTLHPGGYDWNYLPVAGQTFTDSGTSSCHGAPAPAASQPQPQPTAAAAVPETD